MKSIACGLLMLLCVAGLRAQDNISGFQPAVRYLEGEPMRKIVVCKDDQSVWAISEAGKVYYKLFGAATFLEYSGITNPTDLAGYDANHMYFVSAEKLYYSENLGNAGEIVLPSQVNNIAVVNAETNYYVGDYFHSQKDWLAVATRDHIYAFFKGDVTHTPEKYIGSSTTANNVDWKIKNSGFKSIDFQYRSPFTGTPFGNVEHAYVYQAEGSVQQTYLPESTPENSPDVNCTYFEAAYNSTINQGRTLDFWGTDKGLYIRRTGGGNGSTAKRLDVKINDLEEMNYHRDFFNVRLVLVAAEDGLYAVSVGSTFLPTKQLPSEFTVSALFRNPEAVKSIALEVSGSEGNTAQMVSNLCQRAIWLATAKGIMELVVTPARLSVDQFATTRYGVPVNEQNGNKGDYCLSTGDTYTFTVKLPFNDHSKYTVDWLYDADFYYNRKPVPAWTDQTRRTLDERGDYGIRFTSGCGETLDVGSFWLRLPNKQDIDFDYDPVIEILPGCSFTFRTKPGSDYKWQKDDEIIEGETKDFLIAREPGVYRLLVYDYCFHGYTSSIPVELREVNVEQPRISRSSSKSLCFGETVTLSVPEPPAGYSYKWFPTGETSNSIVVTKAGNYYVDLITSALCPKRSATEVVTVNEELKLVPPAQVQICTITNQQLKLTAPEGFVKYTWAGVAGTNNFLNVTSPGEYALEVEDAAGCKANASYIVVPYCPPPVPPNAFSPNGDGVNDTWTVTELNNDPAAVLRIYNRNGVLVFTGTNSKPFWDGRFKGGNSPVGTYYYVVTQKGVLKALTGSLVLIR